jgi:hypothetical protein
MSCVGEKKYRFIVVLIPECIFENSSCIYLQDKHDVAGKTDCMRSCQHILIVWYDTDRIKTPSQTIIVLLYVSDEVGTCLRAVS